MAMKIKYKGTWIKVRGEWVIKVPKQEGLEEPQETDMIEVTKKDGSKAFEGCKYVISQTPYFWLIQNMTRWEIKNYGHEDQDDESWDFYPQEY
jgi:hypothetical protein